MQSSQAARFSSLTHDCTITAAKQQLIGPRHTRATGTTSCAKGLAAVRAPLQSTNAAAATLPLTVFFGVKDLLGGQSDVLEGCVQCLVKGAELGLVVKVGGVQNLDLVLDRALRTDNERW